MGILDDAIREHLELKRKHGVPEEEVERQQEEALGPARREVAQQPEDGEIAAEAVDDASVFDAEERDAPVAEAPVASSLPVETPAPEPFAEEMPDPEPPVADHTGLEPPAAEPSPVAPEPSPVAPEPAPDLDPHAVLGDTEPHGFPALEDDLHEDGAVEDERSQDDPLPAADVDDDELDVLEDTPDFLQETPEHDRLWFEQKPPRDFDFD